MSSKWPIRCLTLKFLLVGTLAFGTTYYVDATRGNDQQSGASPSTAWKSLAKINRTTFQPGDRLLLKSGAIWHGQLWPKGSGREWHPILIGKFAGDANPIIHGDGLAEDAVLLKNQQYWEIENLEITNTGKAPSIRRGVHVAVENFGEAHHIYLRSLTIHHVNGTDSVKENGGIVYTCKGDSKPSRFVDLRIESNHIYHTDRNGIMGWSTHWERSKWYPSLAVVIRKNHLEDIGGDGIVSVATDAALVEYNVVGHANQRSAGSNVAIWAWSADNTLIQHNEAFATRDGHDSEGFDSDWNSRNTVIQYNYSHDNDGGFVLICNDGGQEAKSNLGNSGTIVRYNISQNDHRKVINLAGPTVNTLIYNNTIYVGRDEDLDLFLYSDWQGWPDGTHFYNNIFLVAGKAQFSSTLSQGEVEKKSQGFGFSTNNALDANIFHGITPPADARNTITADPMLIAPGNVPPGSKDFSGYALRPDSPAIDSARAVVGNGGKDFAGMAVPLCKAADRGALESKACPEPK